MPQSKNTYVKGMSKDLSPLKFAPQQYYDAHNIKVVTDKGLSSGAIVNERGMKMDFIIPDTQAVYQIDALAMAGTTITINGVSNLVPDVDTEEEVYDFLVLTYAAEIAAGDFNFYINNDYLVLVGLDSPLTLSSTNSDFTELVGALSGHNIIGWEHLNDSIIVFTTTNTDDDTTLEDGQIWIVDYDESTNEVNDLQPGNLLLPSVHLKYNGCLNFSTEHSITGTVARYETSKIARVYWTDFYNPVSSFNFLDPNGWAIKCDDLAIISKVSLSKPTFTDISNTGTIPSTSTLSMAYRLLGNSKATNVSPITTPLPLYDADDESEDYINIKGIGGDNNKAVSFNIKDIDTDYEFIEYIFIVHQIQNVPLIYAYIETIPATGEINGTFTNSENNLVTVSEAEFNALNLEFNIAKDLCAKDNRLVAANLKVRKFNLEDSDFDARAYRYNNVGVSKIYSNQGDETTIPADYDVDFEHDAINAFNNVDDPNYALYKYKSDGTTLGGEGKYISYEFFTKEILVDDRGDGSGTYNGLPLVGPTSRETYTDDFISNTEHEINNQYDMYVSPFIHNLYTGYHRDEVYRFAIVFYSNYGEVSFAKWIGDIKFPTLREYPLHEGIGLSTVDNPTMLDVLGIKFDVTIPAEIEDVIDGYEIVRVERGFKDMTRLGGGMVGSLTDDGNDTLHRRYGIISAEADIGNSPTDVIMPTAFPLFLFKDYLDFSHKEGDFLTVNGTFRGNPPYIKGVNPTPPNPFSPTHTCYKCLGSINYSTPGIAPIDGLNHVAPGGAMSVADLNDTTTFTNYLNESPSGVVANRTTLLSFPDPYPRINNTDEDNQSDYATYCRTLTKQYGGNTYESRSSNSYIATNAYVHSNETAEIEVFGGDTYAIYFVYESMSHTAAATMATKESIAMAFPCETIINTELRRGDFFQKDRGYNNGINDEATNPYLAYEHEEYTIEPKYLQSANVKTVFQAENFLSDTITELPYTLWISELKQNGEQI